MFQTFTGGWPPPSPVRGIFTFIQEHFHFPVLASCPACGGVDGVLNSPAFFFFALEEGLLQF